MRLVCVLSLALSFGIARADGQWSEYAVGLPLQPAKELALGACEVEVTLQGAIATVEQRERLSNTGPQALAAVRELTLPEGAQLVGFEVGRGAKSQAAFAVDASFTSERVVTDTVLGADPGALVALAPADGKPRFRVIVQPIDPDDEAVITTRWTRTADIRGGALHLVLPAREGKACKGSVHAKPGPGATVARVRIDGRDTPSRTFALDKTDLAIDVDLAFKRNEPIVWTQTESLGDGVSAQAITILAPPGRATGAKRVLFVVDGSRSMELVGRHRIKQLVHALAGMLTRGTEIEAILYNRTATRVLGSFTAIDAKQLAAIETAIDTHTPGNGSDAIAAFTLARQAIADLRGETQVVLITDGVMGDQPDPALAQALGPTQTTVHAIVLSRGRMNAPDADPIRLAINRSGGSYRELDVDELDAALTSLDDWLRPSWLELDLVNRSGTTPLDIPRELRAGTGTVIYSLDETPRKPTLLGRGEKPIKIPAAAAGTAPVAELALAQARSQLAYVGEAKLTALRARHPVADADHAFVVVTTQGKIAKSRREVTASGGPYTRMTALPDPPFPPDTVATAVQAKAAAQKGGSAIDRVALELMFRTQLQPAAFACYQKALARDGKLAGTAQFKIEIGRGETTRASVAGFADATFSACLLDAAYLVTPSLPNPDYNTDDRTVANYPLTFAIREQKPFIIAGDADSSSPLDIDAIKGGVPIKLRPSDTDTPLGNLRPSDKMR